MGLFDKFTKKSGPAERRPPAMKDVDRVCKAASDGNLALLGQIFNGFTYAQCEAPARHAMIAACSAGKVDAVRFMLDFGVPRDMILVSRETPFEVAHRGGHDNVIVLLKTYGRTSAAQRKALAAEAQRKHEADIASKATVLERPITVREKPLKLKLKPPRPPAAG